MRLPTFQSLNSSRRPKSAFTLAEVIICIAVVVILFGAIINAYISSSARAEWTGYSLAAQALAIQQLEQARSAMWDPAATPVKDELSNVPTNTAAIMDLPISTANSNAVWVTNYTIVSTVVIQTNPVISVRMVRVNTVWPYVRNNQRVFFTNTIANYYAPDA